MSISRRTDRQNRSRAHLPGPAHLNTSVRHPEPASAASDPQAKDELDRLYEDAEHSLLRRFLAEHETVRALVAAGTEDIRDWFANSIRIMTQERDAESLGLFAMWLVLESPRDTLVNLAIWLEIHGSAKDEAEGTATDE